MYSVYNYVQICIVLKLMNPLEYWWKTFVVSKLYLLKNSFVVDLIKKCTCWLRNLKNYTRKFKKACAKLL